MAGEGGEDRDIRGEVSARQREARLARLAARRHRVASTAALLALGYSRDQIDRRVAGGRWWRRYRGVFVLGPGKLDHRGEMMAATRFAGPDSAVSGWDAASLHGLHGGRYRGWIDITCPRKIAAPSGIRAHRSPLPRDEVTVIAEIPVTSTGRTVLDCAARRGNRDVERLLERAYQLRRPIRPSPRELMRRHRGRRGLRALRAAARKFEHRSRPTRSDLEEALLALIDRHRLPRPVRNAKVETPRGTFEFDMVWPEQRLVIEVDAPSTHGSRPKMVSDRRKDRGLILAGWTPGRVMAEDLADELRSPTSFARCSRGEFPAKSAVNSPLGGGWRGVGGRWAGRSCRSRRADPAADLDQPELSPAPPQCLRRFAFFSFSAAQLAGLPLPASSTAATQKLSSPR